MFSEFEMGMKETQEKLEPKDLVEDTESAVLEGNEAGEGVDAAAEAAALTPEENAALDDCAADNVQQMLEKYAMDDQEVLAALEVHADSTETKADDGKTSLRIEGGSSCGYGHGCSGSTWCGGCGDLK